VPSMRRPVSVKSVFLLPPCEFLVFEPSRLCRHPSIRSLRFSIISAVNRNVGGSNSPRFHSATCELRFFNDLKT
jgi:hypothetical protein